MILRRNFFRNNSDWNCKKSVHFYKYWRPFVCPNEMEDFVEQNVIFYRINVVVIELQLNHHKILLIVLQFEEMTEVIANMF